MTTDDAESLLDQLETVQAENKKLTQEAAFLKGLLDDVNDKNQKLVLEREALVKAFSEFRTGQRTARELYDLLEKYETG